MPIFYPRDRKIFYPRDRKIFYPRGRKIFHPRDGKFFFTLILNISRQKLHRYQHSAIQLAFAPAPPAASHGERTACWLLRRLKLVEAEHI